MSDLLLHVDVQRSESSVVVGLRGELDISTAATADSALQDLAREHPLPSRVTIDAEHLTFVDAAGLTPLVATLRRLPQGTLRIRNARPQIVRVLRLLDLAAAFGVDGA